MHQHLRKLAIELLDDEHGISEDAWNTLRDLLIDQCDPRNYEDILNCVRAQDNRWFLPEGILESLKD